MRKAEVFKIDDGRLLVDLKDVVAIEHRHSDGTLLVYTRGNHTFSVRTKDDGDALDVIERWLGED